MRNLHAKRQKKLEVLRDTSIGEKYGKLTILNFIGYKNNAIRCEVICECGKIKDILYSSIKLGYTKSCGCLQLEKTKSINETDRNLFIGKKFGRFTIIKFTHVYNGVWCIAECDCGNIKELRFAPIKQGLTYSCGCYNKEFHSTHGLSKSPIYRIWCGIKKRCYRKKNHNYHIYGARGVIMCDEWLNNFKSFYDWCILHGWKKGLHIDRFPDKKGNYCPENCRIATPKQNSNNKNNNRILIIDGEQLTLSQASERFNIKVSTLFNRLNRNMSDYDATHKINRNTKYRYAI